MARVQGRGRIALCQWVCAWRWMHTEKDAGGRSKQNEEKIRSVRIPWYVPAKDGLVSTCACTNALGSFMKALTVSYSFDLAGCLGSEPRTCPHNTSYSAQKIHPRASSASSHLPPLHRVFLDLPSSRSCANWAILHVCPPFQAPGPA